MTDYIEYFMLDIHGIQIRFSSESTRKIRIHAASPTADTCTIEADGLFKIAGVPVSKGHDLGRFMENNATENPERRGIYEYHKKW